MDIREYLQAITSDFDARHQEAIGEELQQRDAEVQAYLKRLRKQGEASLVDYYEASLQRFLPTEDAPLPAAAPFELRCGQFASKVVGYVTLVILLLGTLYIGLRAYQLLADTAHEYTRGIENAEEGNG